ncbi:hypothetical protein F2Q68_00033948 [Brassica cretica]|nr:hypothetical protein F2Q68_00033948 [Brassica cretica]KAF3484976.1 hypothetical protein F2Q69_00052698 [Brassica cretica]
MATWTLPSLLPSRSADFDICPSFDFRSPWLRGWRRLPPILPAPRLEIGRLTWFCTGIWLAPYRGFCSVLEDFVEAVRGFLQVPAAGELFHKFIAENREEGYEPGEYVDIPLQSGSGQGGVEPFAHGSFARPFWECYGEHPLSVLGDVVVRISGAVIRFNVWEGELPGHLDQGDLIRERSICIRVRVALPDRGSYPWEPLYHGLHGIEPLGEHLFQVWASLAISRVDASPPDAVGGRFASVPELEVEILRFDLAELLGALLQLLGVFVELLLQALELRGELGIGLLPSFIQLSYLILQTIDLPLEFGLSLGSFG